MATEGRSARSRENAGLDLGSSDREIVATRVLDAPRELVLRMWIDTVTSEVQGKKTRLTVRMLFGTSDQRGRVIREFGAADGSIQTLGRLEQRLATVMEAS